MAGSEGTVRGTFDLNADPAVRGIRSIRETAGGADAAVRRLGGTLDRVGGAETTRKLNGIASNLRDIGVAGEEAGSGVEGGMDKANRAIAETRTDLRGLRDDVRAFGRERASAHVQINGVAEAKRQVRELNAELDRFAARHATATARIRSSGGLGGAGMGGLPGAAQAAGGGAGGLRAPPGLALAGLGILPLVQALGGTAIGVGGSAAAGAAAAGTIGAAGLATGVVGLAPAALGVKAYAKELKGAETAQTAYNKAVTQYGAASRQAATARASLNAIEKQNPGTAAALGQQQRLSAAAQSQILQPIRGTIGRSYASLLGSARRAIPQIAPGVRQDVRATGRAATSFGSFLTQPGGAPMLAVQAMQHEFARDLPLAEHSLQNVTTLFSNVARVAMPFFHEANVWIEHQTAGWAAWSQNTGRVRTDLQHGVDSFTRWRDLATATFRITRDIFSAGRPQGDNTVTALTQQLDRWDSWIQRNPGKMQRFFSDAWQQTKRIAGAVWEIARALAQVSNVLMPVLGHFAQLVSFAGGAGLLLPTALRAGAGYMLGGRDPARSGGLFAAGRGGGAAAAAGGGALIVGGGSRLGGGTVIGGDAMPASGLYPPTRATPAMTGGRSALDTRSLMLLGSGRRTVPIGGEMPTAGAPQAVAVSQLGARRYGLGRVLNIPAGAIASTALRVAGPVLAVNALLNAAMTPGTAPQRLQAAASGATLGLIPMPTTGAQARAAGSSLAAGHLANFTPANDPYSTEMRIGAVQRALTRARGIAGNRGGAVNQALDSLGLTYNPDQRKTESAAARTYQRELAQLHSLLGRQRDTQDVNTARRESSQFGTAFGELSKEHGPVRGVKQMNAGILQEMRSLRPAGEKVLGQNALSWERTIAQHNPAMRKQYEALKRDIIAQFDAVGQHVRIVNGNILDGSTKQWGQISGAITGPLAVAVAKAQGMFGTLQAEAINSLEMIGFNANDARSLVHGLNRGGAGAASAQLAVTGQRGGGLIGSAQRGAGLTGLAATAPKKKGHATGGRLGGVGLFDSLRMSDGGYGAPGELVVNRHTEGDVNRDLMRLGRPTLEQRVNGETRLHSQMPSPNHDILPDADAAFRQGGGRIGLGSLLGGAGGGVAASLGTAVRQHGHGRSSSGISGSMDAMVQAASAITAHHYPYRFGGGHDPHFTPPYDCSGAVSAVLHAGGALGSPLTSGGFMTFGDPGAGDVTMFANAGHVYMRLGNRYFGTSGSNPGGGAGFFNGGPRPGFVQRHINAGGGSGALGALGGFGGAGGLSIGALSAPRSGLHGVSGAMADRIGQIQAAGFTKRINDKLGAMGGLGGVGGGPLPRGGNAQANMALGRQMMIAAGWPASQWPSLQALWTQESGWNSNSVNPSSGAYGIPQALGHGRPFALGDAGGQIAWGLNYIRQRYGSPAAAEAHERSNNWYATGGRIGAGFAGWFDRGTDFVTAPGRPMMFGAGERRRERVRIEPLTGGGGGGGRGVHVHPGAIVVSGVSDPEAAAEHVVRKLIEAIDRGTVPESVLS